MRPSLLIMATCAFAFASRTSAQHEEHARSKERQDREAQSTVLVGKLVDSTWFVPQEKRQSEKDQVSRASENLANGVPAALIPEGSSEDEKDLWFLLTNATALAPYAGKQIKVEGRVLEGTRGIVPMTVSVGDAGAWRQVQLAETRGKPSAVEPSHGEHADHAKDEKAPGQPVPAHAEHAAEESEPSPKDEGEGHERRHDVVSEEKEHKHGHEHWPVLAMPPAHPLLVNFTAGLFPAAVIAEWLGKLLRRRALTNAAWWMLCFGAVITPLTALAGWLWLGELGDMGHSQMLVHKWLGTGLAVLLPALAIWRARIYGGNRDPGAAYLATLTAVLLAIAVQGHLGATMSFGSHTSEAAHGSHQH